MCSRLSFDNGVGASEGYDSGCDSVIIISLAGIGSPTLLFPDISTNK